MQPQRKGALSACQLSDHAVTKVQFWSWPNSADRSLFRLPLGPPAVTLVQKQVVSDWTDESDQKDMNRKYDNLFSKMRGVNPISRLAIACTLSLFVLGVANAEEIQCRVYPDGEFQAVSVENGFLSDGFLSQLSFDENGQSGAICRGELHHVSEAGNFIQAFNYDNGPDYFTEPEGLARYVGQGDLIGFVDKELNIVIPAQFVCARPFREGLSLVSVQQDGVEQQAVLFPDGRIVVEVHEDAPCARPLLRHGTKQIFPFN